MPKISKFLKECFLHSPHIFLKKITRKKKSLEYNDKDLIKLSSKENIILFYALDAGVEPHFDTLCKVAIDLKNIGYYPLFIKCNRFFKRCPVMEMFSVKLNDSHAINKACTCCQNTFTHYLLSLGLPYINVDLFPIDESLFENSPITIGENLEKKKNLSSLAEKLGYLAFSDTILNSKDSRPILADKTHYNRWELYYKSAVKSYSIAEYLHTKIKPKGIFYFDTYVIHQAPVLSAKKHGIKAFGCKHSYPDTHKLRLDCHSIMTLQQTRHDRWLDFRKFVQPSSVVNECFNILNQRLTGGGSNWYYKKPDDESDSLIDGLLNKSRNKKLICVYPSSIDELKSKMSRNLAFGHPISSRCNIFKDQLNWLEETVEYFRDRDDVVVVFRIHPRMGRHNRLKMPSPHNKEICRLFDDVPDHLIMIEPEHSISSYSLTNIADLIISSGTTLGLESSAIGVPVVRAMWDYDFRFPVDEDIDGIGQTKEEHWRLVEEKLRSKNYNLLKQAKNTIRLLYYSQSAFNVSTGRMSAFDKPQSRGEEHEDFLSYITQILEGKKNSFQYIMDKMQSDNCPKTEERAIVFELKRRIHLVITGKTDNSLFDSSTKQSLHDIFHNSFGKLTLNDKGYLYSYKSNTFEGHLPFVERIHNFINSIR